MSECGAAVSPRSDKYGLGVVFRDEKGLVVDSVVTAEAKAILAGLTMAVDSGFTHLQVESNALGVVNLCNWKINYLGRCG